MAAFPIHFQPSTLRPGLACDELLQDLPAEHTATLVRSNVTCEKCKVARPACRYTVWMLQVLRSGLTPQIEQPCTGTATHLATTQHSVPGLVTQMTVHVCVWHAELIRQGTPGLITLPHRPLTLAALETR
jgi:hypothetical protein